MVFLTKFSYEPSYNKYYDNLLPGLGAIKNGLNINSFDAYTSLAPGKNKLNIKDHLTSNNQVFEFPSNMIDFYEINNSCIFFISYDFYFNDID